MHAIALRILRSLPDDGEEVRTESLTHADTLRSAGLVRFRIEALPRGARGQARFRYWIAITDAGVTARKDP